MSGHRLSLWSRPGVRFSWQGCCACGCTFGPALFRGDVELAHERHEAELAAAIPEQADGEASSVDQTPTA